MAKTNLNSLNHCVFNLHYLDLAQDSLYNPLWDLEGVLG